MDSEPVLIPTEEGADSAAELSKANFDLKLRVYHLEAKLEKLLEGDDEDVGPVRNETAVDDRLERLTLELAEKDALLIRAQRVIELFKSQGSDGDGDATELQSTVETQRNELRALRRELEKERSSKPRVVVDGGGDAASDLRHRLSAWEEIGERFCNSIDPKDLKLRMEELTLVTEVVDRISHDDDAGALAEIRASLDARSKDLESAKRTLKQVQDDREIASSTRDEDHRGDAVRRLSTALDDLENRSARLAAQNRRLRQERDELRSGISGAGFSRRRRRRRK